MTNRHAGLALAMCLFLPGVAVAQTGTGSIAGMVKDATGAVLPGVTVETTSPALIEKIRTAATDGTGQYKLIELPPGTYVVTFTLPGFSTTKREGIELSAGFTAPVNAELRVGSVEETVTVSSESPIVDTQNVRRQTVMTRDVIDAIPTGRTYGNLGALIPGITLNSAASSITPQDVGGASGQSFTRMMIHGGRSSDQSLQVSGMSVTTISTEGATNFYFTAANIQEIVMEVAAQSAEADAGGVRVNIIPKDGGNTFGGSLFGNFGNSSLQSDNYSDELRARGLSAPNRLKRLWDVSASVGGPIRKDKLWFYGAFGHVTTDNYVAGMFINTTPEAWTPTYDRGQQAVDDMSTRVTNGRLTWQTKKNKIGLYYEHDYVCQCHFLVTSTRSPEATSNEIRGSDLFQATWTLPMTNRLLFEAGLSLVSQVFDRSPQPEATQPAIVEQASGLGYRALSTSASASLVYLNQDVGNDVLRGSVSYVTGSHAAKFGLVFQTQHIAQTGKQNNGDISYTVLNGRPTGVTYWALPYFADSRIRPRLAIFGHDQWTYQRLTLNAGLRYDYLRSDYPDQRQPAGQFVPLIRDVPAYVAVTWKDFSPRLGVTFDVFGNGKTALKGSLDRYVILPGTAPSRDLSPVTTNLTNARSWTDRNGDFVVQGDAFNPATNGELGPSTNLRFGQLLSTLRFDPSWAFGTGVRGANWETSVGVEHELAPRISVDAFYFRRAYVNFDVTANNLTGPADYDTYCITVPTDSRLPTSGQPICGLFDLKPAKVGQVDRIRTSASNYGNQYEHWNGFDTTVNVRIRSGMRLQGGASTGKTMTDNCDVVSKVDNPSPLYCHVETPFQTQLKFLGTYMLPWKIQVAGTYQSVPGPQIIANAVFTSAQIAPSLGRSLSSAATATVNVVAPGTMYAERLNQFDLRLAKVFNLGRGRLQAMVDVFNAFNAGAVLALNNTYGTTGASWQVPTFILPARIVKFGAQLTF